MKKLIPVIFLLVGCSSLPMKITGWKNGQVAIFNGGKRATIIGNPQITCYDKLGNKIAEGYFVRTTVHNDVLVDEFGKRFVLVAGDSNMGNYCYLGNNQ